MKMLTFLFAICLVSCRTEDARIPKPRMYPKVINPERIMEEKNNAFCDFTFDFPTYGAVIKDTAFFDEKPLHECWFDLYLKPFSGYIHFSYYPVLNRETLDELIGDSYELVEKHNVKADYRNDRLIDNPPEKIYGILFEIDGPVASPLQFYVTDSTKHFLRASLYFNSQVNRDSIRPIYNFVKTDIESLISSIKWKN